jgi:hypothetical protein
MPGIKLLTKLDAGTCLKLAWRAAQDLGFTLTPLGAEVKRFTATKGNALLGMLAGAIAPYCAFNISIEAYPDANEIVLEKNSPWLTGGKIGVGKIDQQAEALLSEITRAIEREGSAVVGRKEF